MSESTALRLADALKERKATHHTYSGTGRISLVTGNSADPLCRDAAAELRRLHALNGELLEALQRSRAQWIHSVNAAFCLAAIARAEGA
jgi:hypothetical protein